MSIYIVVNYIFIYYSICFSTDDYELKLIGVTATHMVGSGTQTLGNGAVLVYSSTLVLHNSGVCTNWVVYAPTEDAKSNTFLFNAAKLCLL